MKKAAILMIAAAATIAVIPRAAQAQSGAASAPTGHARYAWVKGCVKHEYTVPCGKWTVSLTNGKQVVLGDARVHPRLANGRSDSESTPRLALSSDGRLVSYFRKSDDKLVIRDLTTSKVRAIPGKWSVVPKGLGMGDLDTRLAPDGAVVIDYFDEKNTKPTVLVAPDGTVRKFPGDAGIQGFSPDGSKLLLSRNTEENVTEYLVYDRNGSQTTTQAVPQAVANNGPIALADDGTSIAVVIATTSGKQRLRVYDLAADSLGDSVGIAVPKADSAHHLQWSGGSLELWELRYDKNGNPTTATKRGVDVSSGKTSVVDSFTFKSKAWSWWFPGE